MSRIDLGEIPASYLHSAREGVVSFNSANALEVTYEWFGKERLLSFFSIGLRASERSLLFLNPPP